LYKATKKPVVQPRLQFLADIESLTDYARNKPHHLGLFVLDVFGLQGINLKHGYEFGDQVLEHINDFMKSHSSILSFVRVGSDEYAGVIALDAIDQLKPMLKFEINGSTILTSIAVVELESFEATH